MESRIGCRRWRSNPPRKYSQERLTRGTVTNMMLTDLFRIGLSHFPAEQGQIRLGETEVNWPRLWSSRRERVLYSQTTAAVPLHHSNPIQRHPRKLFFFVIISLLHHHPKMYTVEGFVTDRLSFASLCLSLALYLSLALSRSLSPPLSLSLALSLSPRLPKVTHAPSPAPLPPHPAL